MNLGDVHDYMNFSFSGQEGGTAERQNLRATGPRRTEAREQKPEGEKVST